MGTQKHRSFTAGRHSSRPRYFDVSAESHTQCTRLRWFILGRHVGQLSRWWRIRSALCRSVRVAAPSPRSRVRHGDRGRNHRDTSHRRLRPRRRTRCQPTRDRAPRHPTPIRYARRCTNHDNCASPVHLTRPITSQNIRQCSTTQRRLNSSGSV